MFASTRIVRVRAPADDTGESTSATSVRMRAHLGECGVAVRNLAAKHLTDVTFDDGETVLYDDAWLAPEDVPLSSLEPAKRVLMLLVAERLGQRALERQVAEVRGDVKHVKGDIKVILARVREVEQSFIRYRANSATANLIQVGSDDRRQTAAERRLEATEAVLTTLVPKLESISETLSMQRELEALGVMKGAAASSSSEPTKKRQREADKT